MRNLLLLCSLCFSLIFYAQNKNLSRSEVNSIVFDMSKTTDKLYIDSVEYWISLPPLSLFEDSNKYKWLYNGWELGSKTNYSCYWYLEDDKLYLCDSIKLAISRKDGANKGEYTNQEIVAIMESFTGKTFERDGKMFAQFVTGSFYARPVTKQKKKNRVEKAPIFYLSFNNGKLVSKKIMLKSKSDPAQSAKGLM